MSASSRNVGALGRSSLAGPSITSSPTTTCGVFAGGVGSEAGSAASDGAGASRRNTRRANVASGDVARAAGSSAVGCSACWVAGVAEAGVGSTLGWRISADGEAWSDASSSCAGWRATSRPGCVVEAGGGADVRASATGGGSETTGDAYLDSASTARAAIDRGRGGRADASMPGSGRGSSNRKMRRTKGTRGAGVLVVCTTGASTSPASPPSAGPNGCARRASDAAVGDWIVSTGRSSRVAGFNGWRSAG